MEITEINGFLAYYDKVKLRTKKLLPYIPSDKLEWRYQKDKFSIGDIIRHLACIERFMYAETVQSKPSLYSGCDIKFANGLEETIAFYYQMYDESLVVFKRLSSENLQEKCRTPAGIKITTWKWLRAMVEHEIHHRGQLYMYLGMLGIETPPIYGLTSEEVIAKSSINNT